MSALLIGVLVFGTGYLGCDLLHYLVVKRPRRKRALASPDPEDVEMQLGLQLLAEEEALTLEIERLDPVYRLTEWARENWDLFTYWLAWKLHDGQEHFTWTEEGKDVLLPRKEVRKVYEKVAQGRRYYTKPWEQAIWHEEPFPRSHALTGEDPDEDMDGWRMEAIPEKEGRVSGGYMWVRSRQERDHALSMREQVLDEYRLHPSATDYYAKRKQRR